MHAVAAELNPPIKDRPARGGGLVARPGTDSIISSSRSVSSQLKAMRPACSARAGSAASAAACVAARAATSTSSRGSADRQEHLETFLAHIDDDEFANALPRFVVRELRDYLKCGIQAHGFCRVHCERCNKDEVVAFT